MCAGVFPVEPECMCRWNADLRNLCVCVHVEICLRSFACTLGQMCAHGSDALCVLLKASFRQRSDVVLLLALDGNDVTR